MRYPWTTDRCDTRVLRYDPHVKVGIPAPRKSVDEILAAYARAVAANVARREERKSAVVSIFHRRQAE